MGGIGHVLLAKDVLGVKKLCGGDEPTFHFVRPGPVIIECEVQNVTFAASDGRQLIARFAFCEGLTAVLLRFEEGDHLQEPVAVHILQNAVLGAHSVSPRIPILAQRKLVVHCE